MYRIICIPLPQGPDVFMTLWQQAHQSCQSFTASAAILDTELAAGLLGVYDPKELLFMIICILTLLILAAGLTLPACWLYLCNLSDRPFIM